MAGDEIPSAAVPTNAEEKKGMSKYMSRMRAMLRGGDSRRHSSSSMMPDVASAKSLPLHTLEAEPAIEAASTPTIRSREDLERARHLAHKYNIDLDTSDWKIVEVAERVEKRIRMRIHRSCHICSTSYGANKTCASCRHERCEQCPRYPKKKATGGAGNDVIYTDFLRRPGAETIESLKRKHRYVLTLPSKTGGQDLVLKKPMQRIRRTCHRCENIFMPGHKICSKCDHMRCVDCPRDPPKRKKFPDGYPGDAPGSGDELDLEDGHSPARTISRPRRKVRYSCHNCQAKFKPTELTCQECAHEKCNDCPRVQPKKVESEPDPEVVRHVREKLQALGVSEVNATSHTADPPPEDLPEVDPAIG